MGTSRIELDPLVFQTSVRTTYTKFPYLLHLPSYRVSFNFSASLSKSFWARSFVSRNGIFSVYFRSSLSLVAARNGLIPLYLTTRTMKFPLGVRYASGYLFITETLFLPIPYSLALPFASLATSSFLQGSATAIPNAYQRFSTAYIIQNKIVPNHRCWGLSPDLHTLHTGD